MGSRKTKEQFIADAKKVFGDYYDYSLVDYVNNNTKVKIICPVHGVFEQIPRSHISGRGCQKCARSVVGETLKHTTSEFVEMANKVHNNKYDYSKTKYIRMQDKVCIICKEHGEFWQTPNVHLKGSGCPQCAINSRVEIISSTTERFIKQAKIVFGDRYDYSKVIYKNYLTKVEIICSKHGSFFQLPYQHLSCKGCKKCADELKIIDKDELIKRLNILHHNKYDYSLLDYRIQNENVNIICPVHGVFKQRLSHHVEGAGCPMCESSKGEKLIFSYLKDNNIKFETQKTYDDLYDKQKLRYDFFIPKMNLLIEFNGLQHYEVISDGKEMFEYRQRHDKMKTEYAKKNNINLLVIKYNDDIIKRLQEVLKVS